MHSSTSIAMRFRNSIVVGFMRTSPSEIVGNSSGKPPADSAPRFTASATCRRCALQLVRSEEHTSELQSQSNLVCRLLLEKKKKKTALERPPGEGPEDQP